MGAPNPDGPLTGSTAARAARGTPRSRRRAALAAAVRSGLSEQPKRLPPWLLYDALGSALFEAICQLPWYRITRAELGLLARHGPAIAARLGPRPGIVELGPGSGEKLATLIAALDPEQEARVHLVDVSAAALERARRTVMAAGPVEVTSVRATYERGLARIPTGRRDRGCTLVAVLGSNLGNMEWREVEAFLRRIRAVLVPGDLLLVGLDLVKPEADLLAAYDDPLGVTAAFNRNLLLRLNTELSADFALDRFAHRAVWNAAASRVEMHLVSLAAQEVRVTDSELEFRLEEGETIWTESSYKYGPDALRQLVEPAGFLQRNLWIDDPARFALTLFEAV